MKNHIQKGDRVTYTNATGSAIASGALVKIGVRVGVACSDIAIGASGPVAVKGVYEVTKEAALVVAQGDLLYCNTAATELDKTATAQTLAGYATEAELAGSSTVRVNLNA